MTWPAAGIEMPTPSATCGSTPIVTNSVVPIAKPPMASASTASPKCGARPVAARSGGGGLLDIVTMVQADAAADLFRADRPVTSDSTAGERDQSEPGRGSRSRRRRPPHWPRPATDPVDARPGHAVESGAQWLACRRRRGDAGVDRRRRRAGWSPETAYQAIVESAVAADAPASGRSATLVVGEVGVARRDVEVVEPVLRRAPRLCITWERTAV